MDAYTTGVCVSVYVPFVHVDPCFSEIEARQVFECVMFPLKCFD